MVEVVEKGGVCKFRQERRRRAGDGRQQVPRPPPFYERSPKGSIPDVVYMRIAHRGETPAQINSGFARATRLC